MSGTMASLRSKEHFKETVQADKELTNNLMKNKALNREGEKKKDHDNDVDAKKIKEKYTSADVEANNDRDSVSSNANSGSESDTESADEGDEDSGEECDGDASSDSDGKNEENKETEMEESNKDVFHESAKCGEVHKLHDDAEVSRKGSAGSSCDPVKPHKKKTRILSKLKIHSYFHKSYDKVSNAIIKTSKSILKSGQSSDHKSDKRESAQSSEMLNTLNSGELLEAHRESTLSEEELNMIKNYFEDKTSVEESNAEILNKIKVCLENKDSEKLLNELTELLNERKLLIKSVNHFKNLNTTYKNCLEKYKDSYYILKSENEQLSENAKTLKSCIDSIQRHEENSNSNSVGNDNDNNDSDMTTNNISTEPTENMKD